MTQPAIAAAGRTLARDGYAIMSGALGASDVDARLAACRPLADAAAGARGGVRHLLRDVPAVRALARHPIVRGIADAALGPGAFAVRGILFDKTPGANWKVVWHQDLTIAVRERREVPGFGPWSEKEGVPHVQPPAALLGDMIAVRVHLDDCTDANGPVRVLPGSHRSGRLGAADVDRWRAEVEEVVCTVPRGGILAFHSLLLHASSPAREASHRSARLPRSRGPIRRRADARCHSRTRMMLSARSTFAMSRVVALIATLCILLPTSARAQATASGFRTGPCVAPDTSSGTLDPVLAATVGAPERRPIAIPTALLPYPPEVRRDGYRGRVVVAFVVDTMGHAVARTAEVLESTDPLMSRWACGAVATLRFHPAHHEGRPAFAQAVQAFVYGASTK